jgi:hypothetical protein
MRTNRNGKGKLGSRQGTRWLQVSLLAVLVASVGSVAPGFAPHHCTLGAAIAQEPEQRGKPQDGSVSVTVVLPEAPAASAASAPSRISPELQAPPLAPDVHARIAARLQEMQARHDARLAWKQQHPPQPNFTPHFPPQRPEASIQ